VTKGLKRPGSVSCIRIDELWFRHAIATIESMKKFVAILIFGLIVLPAPTAFSATFKNCSQVNRLYPFGVAKSLTAAKKQKGYPVNNPYVSSSLYKSIAKMDRDKDSVACEK